MNSRFVGRKVEEKHETPRDNHVENVDKWEFLVASSSGPRKSRRSEGSADLTRKRTSIELHRSSVMIKTERNGGAFRESDFDLQRSSTSDRIGLSSSGSRDSAIMVDSEGEEMDYPGRRLPNKPGPSRREKAPSITTSDTAREALQIKLTKLDSEVCDSHLDLKHFMH